MTEKPFELVNLSMDWPFDGGKNFSCGRLWNFWGISGIMKVCVSVASCLTLATHLTKEILL